MHMKKLLFFSSVVALMVSCSSSYQSGELSGTQTRPVWDNEVPFGMLFIPQGSLNVGPSDQDVAWANTAQNRTVSVQSFWMDETEITNKKGKKVRCISCYAPQMASVASATLAAKVILRFHPQYLFMTGICAGLKGNGIGFGDVLIASHVWDGMSGKIKEESDGKGIELVFEPDYHPITLNTEMLNIANRLKDKKDLCTQIKNDFDGEKPDSALKIHVGQMTSVPAVIASDKKIQELKVHARKLIGLEMESYGIFYAAENAHHLKPKFTVSFKSASDLADKDKTDKYQAYASYTSSALMKYVVENELNFDA